MRGTPDRLIVMLGVFSVLGLSACGGRHPASVVPAALPLGVVSLSVPQRVGPAASRPARRLVRWRGPVEHLFFHTLVLHPRLAFRGPQGRGFRDYFVTVDEFRRILGELYRRRWTLVDLHRAVRGRVKVPRGRRPFVLSEDDVNYYRYEQGHGIARRLVLDHGRVRTEDRNGGRVRVSDDDLVPILDTFVRAHPLFSVGGAKGVLGLTGYEGLFGERVQDHHTPGLARRIARARAVARRLHSTGWTFASHTYGHIDLARDAETTVVRDAQRWRAQAEPILGRTDVLIYPFGSAPPPGSPQAQALARVGYRIQLGIDAVPRLVRAAGLSVMARRHIDGIAFAQQRHALRRLFSVRKVEDVAARR